MPRQQSGHSLYAKAMYDIEIKNPDHVCRGVKKVTVDGEEISGNVLPAFGDGKTHKATVILG